MTPRTRSHSRLVLAAAALNAVDLYDALEHLKLTDAKSLTFDGPFEWRIRDLLKLRGTSRQWYAAGGLDSKELMRTVRPLEGGAL